MSGDPRMIPAGAVAAHSAPAGDGDWRRAWRSAVRDPAELLALLDLQALAPRLATGNAGFALRVPRSFVRRMRRGDPHDPLLRQVLPLDDELRPTPGFGLDAVGDLKRRIGPGVLHKYHGRALLVATGSCAVHCRYCFRRHFPYAEETAAAGGWQAAVAAIGADPSIGEVILSGGDPLSLATPKLRELTDQLATLPQIRRLRLHSRLPVVLPERVDAALLGWLGSLPWQKVLVIHANHANEFDDDVDQALTRLARAGVTLLNQAVLLRGVNDDIKALADLSERCFAAGVQPYYLHQLDRVSGTAHFEVSDRRALQLLDGLRERLPGFLVPRLVREVAGEPAKQPL